MCGDTNYHEVAFHAMHDAKEDLGFRWSEADRLGSRLVARFVGHSCVMV